MLPIALKLGVVYHIVGVALKSASYVCLDPHTHKNP